MDPDRKNLERRFACVLLAIGVLCGSAHALAQQSSTDAVETFEPAFDVGVVMRPRAGLFGITELMMAALEADIPRAKQLLAAGADINERDDSQSTPLMWAVHSGDVNTVKFFVAAGADVRAKAYRNATALMNAMTSKREAIAVALIEAGADANGRGNSARNYLEDAAESGMVDVVNALILHGTDLDTYGPSALNLAVSRGKTATTRRLLDAGVDANGPTIRSDYSLLYNAAASGKRELVELLITRGADAAEHQDSQSPLYPAASRGHTAVAELLVAHGATPTPSIILAATRGRHGGTAVALLNKLALEQAETADVERLLAAAEELGNDEFTMTLLNSKAARSVVNEAELAEAAMRKAAAMKNARLVFARQTDNHCSIGVWDSRTGSPDEVVRIATCPDELFVSADRRSLFVVDGNAVRIVSLDMSSLDQTVALPNLDYRPWLGQLSPPPDQNPDYLPSMTDLRPQRIGYLADGSLGLVLSLWMPADDEFHYLFRFENGRWSTSEGQHCGRWGCESQLSSLTSLSTRNWPEYRMIWHPAVGLNPYHARQSVDKVELEYEHYEGTTHHREFEIEGVVSTLSAYTSPSEHSDTHHTFGVNLTIAGNPPQELSDNQCQTSIVGRHILVFEYFQGRFEVTDMRTGLTVLDSLKTALWLD